MIYLTGKTKDGFFCQKGNTKEEIIKRFENPYQLQEISEKCYNNILSYFPNLEKTTDET